MGPGEHHLEGTCEELAAAFARALEGDRRVEGRRVRAHWGFVAAMAAILLLPAAITSAQGEGLAGAPLWLCVAGLFLVLAWFIARQVGHCSEADLHDVDEHMLGAGRRVAETLAPRVQGPLVLDLALVQPRIGETPWLRLQGRLKQGAAFAFSMVRERQPTGRKVERRSAAGQTRTFPEERHREYMELELWPWERIPEEEGDAPPGGLVLERVGMEEGRARVRLTGGTRICAENERNELDFGSPTRGPEGLLWALKRLHSGNCPAE